MKIEILGPGCSRCRATEELVRKALAELKLEAEIAHVSDPVQFARRLDELNLHDREACDE